MKQPVQGELAHWQRGEIAIPDRDLLCIFELVFPGDDLGVAIWLDAFLVAVEALVDISSRIID